MYHLTRSTSTCMFSINLLSSWTQLAIKDFFSLLLLPLLPPVLFLSLFFFFLHSLMVLWSLKRLPIPSIQLYLSSFFFFCFLSLFVLEDRLGMNLLIGYDHYKSSAFPLYPCAGLLHLARIRYYSYTDTDTHIVITADVLPQYFDQSPLNW